LKKTTMAVIRWRIWQTSSDCSI